MNASPRLPFVTISNVSDIMPNIQKHEEARGDLAFYNLIAYTGTPNTFEFLKVEWKLTGSIVGKYSWKQVICPVLVKGLFRDYLPVDARQTFRIQPLEK